MKVMKHVICIAAVAAVVLSSSFTVRAAQEETSVRTETAAAGQALSKNIFLNRDIEFRGGYGSDRTYITVDDHWRVNGATLHLSLSISQLTKSSVLTVLVNDKPVHSEMLRGDVERKRVLDLNLPLDALKKGSNEIRMEVSQAEGIPVCVRDRNDGSWVLIDKTSYIHLAVEEMAATELINEFPYPFLKASASSGKQASSIVIPDQAEEEEMAAALQTAASLGALSKGEEMDLSTMTYSQLMASDRKTGDLIFVGKWKHLPEEIRAKTPQEVTNRVGEGAFLYRIQSPYSAGKLVMGIVTDREDGMLDTAAKLLLNQDMVSQIDSNVAFIRPGTNVSLTQKPASEQVTLKELGYQGGIHFKGPGRQQSSIGINLPSNRLVLPGAKAALQIRYGKNIDYNKSLVTVYVNGTPVGSKKLEPDKADGDTIEVSIPSSTVTSHYVELSVAFDLQLTDYNCTGLELETPWGFVGGESTIYLPTQGERALLLENYPWPFMKDGRWNDTAVVLPKSGALEELDYVADLIAYMGQSLQDNTGTLRVIKEDGFNEQNKDSNMIMLGTPEKLGVIKTVNDSLWFKYDSGFGYFLSNEKRRLMEDFSGNLASIQLLPSPLNSERGLLVITAPKADHLARAEKFLTESKFISTLVGNALLIDRWDNALNHYFVQGDNLALTEKVSMSSPQLKIFAILFGTVLLILIVGMVFYFRKYRRG
ncbi:cellulose biosynthesis cyclic di-GMP-binding regulatory protein BcsB [Paenibacillus sp. y28]|uniref:cellulose biosynthesis cyclic di-GMP-binding regulatory protein BcsB n=1 Tax=Paenibacillus sp. y28 TaxID=3129110 RepID=UPI003018B8FC